MRINSIHGYGGFGIYKEPGWDFDNKTKHKHSWILIDGGDGRFWKCEVCGATTSKKKDGKNDN